MHATKCLPSRLRSCSREQLECTACCVCHEALPGQRFFNEESPAQMFPWRPTLVCIAVVSAFFVACPWGALAHCPSTFTHESEHPCMSAFLRLLAPLYVMLQEESEVEQVLLKMSTLNEEGVMQAKGVSGRQCVLSSSLQCVVLWNDNCIEDYFWGRRALYRTKGRMGGKVCCLGWV
eukprot:1157637-Pelagomonas_calceolata.AAC.7